MQSSLESLEKRSIAQIQIVSDEEALRNLEIEFLGKKSEIYGLSREISKLPKEERPQAGQKINMVKKEIENAIEYKKAELESEKMNHLAEDEWMDISASFGSLPKAGRHPISAFIDDLVEVFAQLGFSQVEGPEIESEWYNFTALNIHSNHPAREMQDTFFLKDVKDMSHLQHSQDEQDTGMVLRTQTSSVQIRYMQQHTPPIQIIAPGKVYRKDSDATHSPMFHQTEGLMVGENISLKHLKAVLQEALRSLLDQKNLEIRFRLSYFPFTEPSLELDISFPMKGKKDYWLEVGGAGMTHPNVLSNAGIDNKKYNAFAFGLGLDRLVMIKHNIQDLRLFFENDTRFLSQF